MGTGSNNSAMRIKKLPEIGIAAFSRTFVGTRLFLCAMVFAAGGALPGWASAQTRAAAGEPDEFLVYRLSEHDTLIGIGRALLEQPGDWRQVAALNGLFPHQYQRLRVGHSLRIPRSLLKSQPTQARVTVASGNVSADGKPARVGELVGEAALLNTGADGILEIQLGDGSTLRLAPNSRMRLERLRRYHRDDIVEARTLLEAGRVEAQAGPQRRKPLQIRTPFATAAVRGTQFRVGSAADVVTAEVLEGGVQWGQPTDAVQGVRTTESRRLQVAVSGGFGAAGSRAGVTAPERLLPAPNLAAWPGSVQTAVLGLDFGAVEQARAYRIQISEDPAFVTLIQERVQERPRMDYATRRDGSLYVRVRPIAASSVEGYDQVARIDVRARPFAPVPRPAPNSGVLFEPVVTVNWNTVELASGYRLQLAEDEAFSRILSEQQLTDPAARLVLAEGNQARTTRFWRIAGVNSTGGYLGPYSESQRLRFYALPAAPRLERSEVERATLGWAARPGERYRLEIADNQAFDRASRFDVATAGYEFVGARPGRYFARLAALTDDGVTTPYSPPFEFVVRAGIQTGSGLYLESGSGARIQGRNE